MQGLRTRAGMMRWIAKDDGLFCAAIMMIFTLMICGTAGASPLQAADAVPASLKALLKSYCVDCHLGAQAEGGFDLDQLPPPSVESADRWERIYDVLDRGEMPPRDVDQPSSAAKRAALSALTVRLLQYSPVGGTVARRLNREEYENTLRDLFAYPEFSVPESFPPDDTQHGFDNIGKALVISPTLMQQYMDLATALADEILPPQRGPVPFTSKQYKIAVEHLNQSACDAQKEG